MRVLLDAHVLGQRETGNETYIRELLRNNGAFDRAGVRIIAAVRPGQYSEGAESVAHPRLGDDVYRLTRLLPELAAGTGANLAHVTYHGPLTMGVPMVVTIHDVSYRLRPRFHSLRNVLVQNILGYLTARRACMILTVSEFCRGEIQRVYPFARDRIAVTYNATELPAPPPADRARARLEALGLSRSRFVFSIGLFQPRKNLQRLARAFIAEFGLDSDIQLVLAGENRTGTGEAILREFSEWIDRGRIVLPGYVDPLDASILYSECACFAFPSLYEGFGLPLVEAMHLGAPILTSSTTALPEIVGDAATLVNPEDERDIGAGLRRMLSDPDLARSMSERGRRRASRFGGDRFAAATADAYRRALSDRLA